MRRFSLLDEIWDFAIGREIEARDFYKELAQWAERPQVARAFEELADDELQHKLKLEALRAGKVDIRLQEVGNLGIADGLETAEPKANLTYVEALVLAMQREKQAFRLYTDLASASKEPQTKSMFRKLAQEEAEHKLRLEIEYDLTIF
jgi:rubrerythrin